MSTVYPTMTQLVMAAKAVLGHEPEIVSRKALLRSVAEPAMAAGAIQEYETLSEKAAALMVAVADRQRPFRDGNKRAAFAAGLLLLALNGYKLDLPPEEAADLIELAAGGGPVTAMSGTIAAHLDPY